MSELGLPQRFWDKVLRRPDRTGCWEWTASKFRDGYGRFRFEDEDRSAHRTILEAKIGRRLAPGEQALHECDNPGCVNPAHLRPGSHRDNMSDRDVRNRTPRGERIGAAKLTEERVRAIRRDSRTCVEIARAFGVSDVIVGKIKRRLFWKHVD